MPERTLPASGAAVLLERWRAAWAVEAPWFLLAPEARAAAWADALRAALLAQPAVAYPAEDLRRHVRAAAGFGAALICGGQPAADGGGLMRPALFALAPPTPALRRAWSAPAPLIGLAARAAHEPLDLAGLLLEDFIS